VLGNAVIAISSELKQQIKQRFAVDENFIHLIHHGVDESQFKSISLDDRVQSRRTISIPAKAKVVCLIGGLERRKGHDQLIKSLQILRSEGIEVYALFAGAEKGEWKCEIEQLAIDLNVADGCILHRDKYKCGLREMRELKGSFQNNPSMLSLSPEDQAALKHHLQQAAKILKDHTEPEKLKDFESLEVEVRHQVQTHVSPVIGEFFCPQTPQNTRAPSKA
jgi:glycosyltransferase involved in cell wall biosynthesis